MGLGRPLLVAPAGEPGEARLAHDAPDGRRAERFFLLPERPHDIVDGEVLLAQRDDLLVQPRGLRRPLGRLRPPGGVAVGQKKWPARLLSELVAKDAKAARRVAELRGGLLRGKFFDEVSSQRFVLAMGGAGWDEECLCLVC
ncbi:MAG: hypothetical protein ACREH8_03555 [Opitutaceae bacterium]